MSNIKSPIFLKKVLISMRGNPGQTVVSRRKEITRGHNQPEMKNVAATIVQLWALKKRKVWNNMGNSYL